MQRGRPSDLKKQLQIFRNISVEVSHSPQGSLLPVCLHLIKCSDMFYISNVLGRVAKWVNALQSELEGSWFKPH